MEQDTNEVRQAFIEPFIKLIPWIIANPLSKRLPKGFSFGGKNNRRNGWNSIERFCMAWQSMSEGYRHLITEQDEQEIAKVFELRDKLFPENY